jgi:hypothetical protein
MARWKSHEALRLGRYGFSCRSVAASRASAAQASAMPSERRRRWRIIAPNPPNDSGDWMPDASPICRTRSATGGRGLVR